MSLSGVEKYFLLKERRYSLVVLFSPFILLNFVFGITWINTDILGLDYLFICEFVALVIQAFFILITIWFPQFKARVSYIRVEENRASSADKVLIIPKSNCGQITIVPIFKDASNIYFIYQNVRIFYSSDNGSFYQPEMYESCTIEDIISAKGIENEIEYNKQVFYHGVNSIELPILPFKDLLKQRVLAPFFVFQLFCVLLWSLDDLVTYSLFVLLLLLFFESTYVFQQIKNMKTVRGMIPMPGQVDVFRNGDWKVVMSNEIVPGDIFLLSRSKNNAQVPCDSIILNGSCLINESLLTGESIPQFKESIICLEKNEIFDWEVHSKAHVIYCGSTVVSSECNSNDKKKWKVKSSGCICLAVKTGFNTSKGKLLRTILFAVQSVTENNKETFGFIIFLLFFAVCSATYVWNKGVEDLSRDRYKLFIECLLILTSVVPPELPIELSLAVNTSLVQLTKNGIFCTEPFRIPFAGKIDVCCFDKTGTLTEDKLIVHGISSNQDSQISSLKEASTEAILVLVGCHSVFSVDGVLYGDPLEKASISLLDCIINGDTISLKRPNINVQICKRFPFSSTLKRMSAIISVGSFDQQQNSILSMHKYFSVVKGAPETIKNMLKDIPTNYDQIFKDHTLNGYRIISLAYKPLNISVEKLSSVSRDESEMDLIFIGFLVASTPIKSLTNSTITELKESCHQNVIITGDHPFNSCYISQKTAINDKPLLILEIDDFRHSIKLFKTLTSFPIENEIEFSLDCVDELFIFIKQFELCITGKTFNQMTTYVKYNNLLKKIFLSIRVFARCNPKDKEKIVCYYKTFNLITLMCGDGTNDMGALRHADVGIALLIPCENSASIQKISNQSSRIESLQIKKRNDKNHDKNKKPISDLISVLNEDDEDVIVRLGDASIAAPFTTKSLQIKSVIEIIRQGRCTLLTTLKMFKILALNSLIFAYSQSVLYVNGIKFSDSQATFQGMSLALSFLFVAQSQPMPRLAKKKPLPNIFNWYMILTVLLQSFVHLSVIIFLYSLVDQVEIGPTEKKNWKSKFEPSLANTLIYIASISLQLATFAVNYKGHPHTESLFENKKLLRSIIIPAFVVVLIIFNMPSELCSQLQLVSIPEQIRFHVLGCLILDLSFAYLFDRILSWIFNT